MPAPVGLFRGADSQGSWGRWCRYHLSVVLTARASQEGGTVLAGPAGILQGSQAAFAQSSPMFPKSGTMPGGMLGG